MITWLEKSKLHLLRCCINQFFLLTLMLLFLFAEGYSANTRRDVVLGDLTREEALRFVVGDKDSSGSAWPGLISAHKDLPPLYKEDWEKVWATCGGNIQLLGVCVDDVSVYGDWGKGKILKVYP